MNAPRTKLLIVAHSGSQGGAELCLDTTLRYLDRQRFNASVLFGWDGPMVASAREMGYDTKIEPWASWMGYARSAWHYKNAWLDSRPRVRRLADWARREQFDLVYTNTAVIHEGARIARAAELPHVWHVHEILRPEHTKPRMMPLGSIARRIGQWSDRVIFESDAARRLGLQWIPAEKTVTIHNSVRLTRDATTTTRAAARAALELDPNTTVVLWLGRFSPRKNPLLLIRAAATLCQQANPPNVVFLFVGEGPLEADMTTTITTAGLTDICQILPFRDDIRPLLAAGDLLVLTSDEESFGLVLVEAGAFELPVIATRVEGPSEIVAHNETGLLIPPADVSALTLALERLLPDAPLRNRLGKAGALCVAERFSPETNTRRIEAIFEKACRASRIAPTIRKTPC